MFTKQQLAEWRAMGFEFDDFYDSVAVEATPKIVSIEFIKEAQKTETQKNFIVKINLDTFIANNKLIIEIDQKIFSTYQKNDNIRELNTFFANVFIDFSTIARLNESFNIAAKIIDMSNKIIETKSIIVNVDSIGNVGETNERVEEINNHQTNPNSMTAISLEQLIAFGVSKKKAIEYIDSLNKTLQDYKINTDLKIAHFLAQLMSESGCFKYTSEIGATDAHYKGFKGRGLIQITWEANYSDYEDYEGEDFTSSLANKQKLEKSPYAIRSAGWFWSIKAELNDDSDKNDFIYCTYKVNGGFNGFDSRLDYLKKGFKALNKDYVEFDFQSSKIYNNTKACFAWGLWNDPDIKSKLFDTCKSDKNNAIEGYKRVLDLVSPDFDTPNWYGIQKLKEFENIKFIKNKKKYVKIVEAAKQRLEKLQE